MATIKIVLFAIAKFFWIPTMFLGIIYKMNIWLGEIYKLEGWKLTMFFCLGSVSCLFYLVMQLQRILRNQQDLKRGNIELQKEVEELKRQRSNGDPNY